MIISIDFDGTIVRHRYPEIGEPLPGAFETMKDLVASGHRLVLNTCREDCPRRQYLTEAVRFCRDNGVEFVSVNETSLEDDFRYERGLRRKVYANCYIDDTNLGGFPGWEAVREEFGLSSLTRPCTEELRETASDSSTAGQQGGMSTTGFEGHPGCLGAL